MAFTLLDNALEDADGTSASTASVTPTGGALILLGITVHDDASAPETVDSFGGTGWANGITWTLESQEDVTHEQGGSGKTMLYSATAPGSPSSGSVTVNFVSTHEKFMLYLMEDTTNPDVIQTVSKSELAANHSGTLSIDLAGTPTGLTGMVCSVPENASISSGTGFTDMSLIAGGGTAPQWVMRGCFDDANATDPVVFDTAPNDHHVGIAFETGTASTGITVSLGTVSFNFDLGEALGVLRELVPATFDLAPQALTVKQPAIVSLGTVEFPFSPQTLSPGVGAGQTIPLGVVAFNFSPQDIAWQRLRDLGVAEFSLLARPLGVSGGASAGGGSSTGITNITDTSVI